MFSHSLKVLSDTTRQQHHCALKPVISDGLTPDSVCWTQRRAQLKPRAALFPPGNDIRRSGIVVREETVGLMAYTRCTAPETSWDNKKDKKVWTFVINREKCRTIVTLGGNRERAMKNRSLPGKFGGLASMRILRSWIRLSPKGRAHASVFVEQPIGTLSLRNDLWLVKVSRHGLDFLKPENRAMRRCRSLVFSQNTWITICWKVIMEFLPNDAKNILPTPALIYKSWINTSTY